MKIAFIGAGKMAQNHVERLAERDGVEITAICDIDETAASDLAATVDAAATTDHRDLFTDHTFDVLFLVIPPFAYDDHIALAAKHGIDCFVEKPVALHLADARKNQELVDEHGIITGVGHVFRYDRITDRAMALLDGRTVGLIDARYWSGLPASPWGYEQAKGGGEITFRSTHVYDLVRYFGGDVEQVTARGTERIGVEEVDYEDAISATMRHENGVVSHVSSTVAAPDWTVEVDLIGDEFRLRLDYPAQSLTGIIDGEEISYHAETDRIVREHDYFLTAVSEREPGHVRSDHRDGMRTLALTQTVQEALKTDGTSVL